MLGAMRVILNEAYRAGIMNLPHTGASLDAGKMDADIDELIPEVMVILDALAARNAALEFVVKDLLEQHERQLDMEDCGRRCSYPSKFPEWERAWNNAQEVLFG